MRLIDADEVYKILESCEIRKATIGNPLTEWEYGYTCGIERAEGEIECASTIDAVPVKHGKWKLIRMEDNGDGFYTCSNCDRGDIHSPLVSVPYCWYCGARMDKE